MRHPLTGQRCWFNQIAFLNEWTIDPEVREYLVDVYGEVLVAMADAVHLVGRLLADDCD